MVDNELIPKAVYVAHYDLFHCDCGRDADIRFSNVKRGGTRVFCRAYETTAWSGGMKKTVTRDIHRESFAADGGKQRICVNL